MTRLTVRLAARPLERLGRWLSDHLIQNVPEEISVCEYECQEAECNIAKWAMCQKRLASPEQALLRIE